VGKGGSNKFSFLLSFYVPVPYLWKYCLLQYLATCPKNDVISFSRKRFCALGVRVKFRVRVEVRGRVSGNTFKYVLGQTSIRPSVLDSLLLLYFVLYINGHK